MSSPSSPYKELNLNPRARTKKVNLKDKERGLFTGTIPNFLDHRFVKESGTVSEFGRGRKEWLEALRIADGKRACQWCGQYKFVAVGTQCPGRKK